MLMASLSRNEQPNQSDYFQDQSQALKIMKKLDADLQDLQHFFRFLPCLKSFNYTFGK